MSTLQTGTTVVTVPGQRRESASCPLSPAAARCSRCGRAGALRVNARGVEAWYDVSAHVHDANGRCAESEWTLHTSDRCSAISTWDVE